MEIWPSTVVGDLGVEFESDMSMTRHVGRLADRFFRHLCLIRSCVRSLSFEAARTAVVCSAVPQVDRCNSLPAGDPKISTRRLVSVLNAAAILICNKRRFDQITPLRRDALRWFPMPWRVQFKLLLTCFQSFTWSGAGLHQDVLRSASSTWPRLISCVKQSPV